MRVPDVYTPDRFFGRCWWSFRNVRKGKITRTVVTVSTHIQSGVPRKNSVHLCYCKGLELRTICGIRACRVLFLLRKAIPTPLHSHKSAVIRNNDHMPCYPPTRDRGVHVLIRQFTG